MAVCQITRFVFCSVLDSRNKTTLNCVSELIPDPHCIRLTPQLKTFGAKLKERNNFFRKMSKAQSHEMKEVLYSDLLQVNMVR